MKGIVISIMLTLILSGGIGWYVFHLPPAPHWKSAYLIEATSSVPDDVRAQAHDAIEADASSLKRGDELVLVPITSDAATEAAGRVLRLRITHQRQAYDADLKRAHVQLKGMLDKLRADAVTRPYSRTDLLGTLRLAAEERNLNDPNETFSLIVLSDMLNDTAHLNFMTAPALANESSARQLARQLMSGHERMWTGARIFLGQLRSNDLKRVKSERRDAIRAFWVEYFQAGGATQVVFATDGLGQLSDFTHPLRPEN